MNRHTPVSFWSVFKQMSIVAMVFLMIGEQHAQNIMSVAPPETDNSVESELASFSVSPGYTIELFASEALGIANPVAMRWDEKGRLWVLCTTTYPHPELGKQLNDKLLILEDRNGDGKADTTSVFADGLNIPLGFELGHGGVYLGEQSELVFLEDTDKDGKADKRTLLFSGFGTGDLHQTLNSFTWSPGGDLYFSQGHNIYSRIETPWGIKKANRAGIWRYRPTSGKLDNFFDWSTASVNPWGMTFNDWGEMFHKANDPEVFYSVPGLVEESNHDYLPDIGKLVIKGSGIIIPRSQHIPDNLRHDFVLAGYYNNRIERMKVTDDSSGYKVQLTDPLVISSSRSFRPIEVNVGPDGAIYILDWYNPIIGHYQASVRHPERDKRHGRIWRLTANNRALTSKPNLHNQPVATLLYHLQSDEYWVRYQVRRLLAEKPTEAIDSAVSFWISQLNKNDKNYERHLLEAAGVFESHAIVNEEILQRLIGGKAPGARAYAAKLLSQWHYKLPDALSKLEQLVNDPSAKVRLHAVVALSYLQVPAAVTIAAMAFDHPTDKFIRYAWDKTVYSLRPYWEEALQKGILQVSNPKHLALIINKNPPDWLSAEMLRSLMAAPDISHSVKTNLLIALAKKESNKHIGFVIREATQSKNTDLLHKLSSLQPTDIPAEVSEVLNDLLNTKAQTPFLAATIQLVRNWNLTSVSPTIATLAQNTETDHYIRAEALLTLGRLEGTQAADFLKTQIQNKETPLPLRLAALKSLAAIDIGTSADIMFTAIQQPPFSVNNIKDYITPIAGQAGGIQALTEGLQKHTLSPELAKLMLEALALKGMEVPALRTRLRTIAGDKNTIPSSYDQSFTEKIVRAVKEKGDPAKGEQVYLANPACASCHNINNKGGNIGPNLSALGRGLSPEEILIEVLWPTQNIKEGYNYVTIENNNNEFIQGNKVWEDKELVVVVKAGGLVDRIPKTSIKKMEVKGSLMPSGLLDGISEGDLADLISYLSRLGL